jgi:hypothetical protein
MAQKLEYELKGKSDVEQVTGRAKKSVDSLGDSFKKAGSDIGKKLAGMFAATVLFDKALSFLSNTFKQLGEVADQVDRSGLSAEQFQGLAYAAQQSGVSVSVLAKATRQLRVDMAEAAAGTGKKVEMFKALGVTMEQLKAGDATSVFLAISAALGGGADDSERLLITTALFGDKIGNDILPMLNDFQKLQKDIADAPIVDAKTLKAMGDYNDGMDRLNASMVKLAANLFNVYNNYSKWASKVAEDAATGLFNFLDRFAPGAASSAVTGAITSTPMGAALVAMGADGSTTPTGTTAAASGGADKSKALLAAIKAGGASTEKEKAADTKGTTSSTGAISGNVIGVGANPIVTALQEQQGIALQQLTCLQILAAKYGYTASVMDVTASGATPSTPANASPNRSPLVTKSK